MPLSSLMWWMKPWLHCQLSCGRNILALLGGSIIYYCKVFGVFGGLIHYDTSGSDPSEVSYHWVCYPALPAMALSSKYSNRAIPQGLDSMFPGTGPSATPNRAQNPQNCQFGPCWVSHFLLWPSNVSQSQGCVELNEMDQNGSQFSTRLWTRDAIMPRACSVSAPVCTRRQRGASSTTTSHLLLSVPLLTMSSEDSFHSST